jgi:iron complex transport system substrate-binding protein
MKCSQVAGVLAGCLLIVSSCGDDGSDPVSAEPAVTTDATEPQSGVPDATDVEALDDVADETMDGEVIVETTGPEVTDEDAAPSAIISLSPTATEMLYAIGAGDQVLAVEDFSNYPPEAAEKMQGISGYEPNVEAIVGLEPDLILTDGTNPDFLAQLDTLGIAHWEGFAAVSFDDVYEQLEQLGAATGHVAEAAELVGQMQADVAAVKAELPQLDEPLTYYHELDNTLYSVTSDTFIGAVYDEIGLVNIADAVGDGNPYPQLSAEFIIAENPDLIFLACTLYCGETADTLAARPGWDSLDALANGGVIEMNDDVASRWGPRIVEYLETAGAAVARVAAVAAG